MSSCRARPHDDWQLVLFEMELYGPETPAEELSPVHFIRLRLTDDAGNLLSENFYWRSNRLGDYRALNDLEPAKLDVRTKAETVDGKRIIRATVTNRGRSVAFAVRLMPVYASTGEQILPVIMDDNYFTLLRDPEGRHRDRRVAARGRYLQTGRKAL